MRRKARRQKGDPGLTGFRHPTDAMRGGHGRSDPPATNEGRASAALYLADTGTPRGNGVFAGRDFVAGELLEACTVLPYRMSFDRLGPALQRLVFDWSDDDDPRPFHAHVLGFGSFYTHANPANCRYEAHRDALEMRFYTVEAVTRGTELTINYDGDGGPTADEEYWFEEMGIRRL